MECPQKQPGLALVGLFFGFLRFLEGQILSFLGVCQGSWASQHHQLGFVPAFPIPTWGHPKLPPALGWLWLGKTPVPTRSWHPLVPAPPASPWQRLGHLRDVPNPWIKLGLRSALPLLLVVFRSSYHDLECSGEPGCSWSLSHGGTFLSPPEAISSPAEQVPKQLGVSLKCLNSTAPED